MRSNSSVSSGAPASPSSQHPPLHLARSQTNCFSTTSSLMNTLSITITCPFSAKLHLRFVSVRFPRYKNFGQERLSASGKPVVRGQVFYHPVFKPVMERQKHSSERDHERKVLPWLALCDCIDVFLKDEEDKLETHQEGEESYQPDRVRRYPEHTEHHKKYEQGRDPNGDCHVLDIVLSSLLLRFFLL